MELRGKTALVTGGTSGIGLATARLLARAGADVVITGRDARRGKDAVHATREDGEVRFVPSDLADLDSVAELSRSSGPVDILVNNAGAFPAALTLEQSVAGYDRVFNTNVRGPYFLVAALVPHMIERGGGSIVNVTTLAAHRGFSGASAYSASKAALASLTRTWALEFADGGVRVNSVAPGPTRTEGVLAEWGEEGNEGVARDLGLTRTAAPSEIAEAILFLASPRASYITGTTLHVDAGGTAF
ncbi:3-oxoacyl-[acyl-carrier protein] reductase [[Actinomadura] parvosata subsp. kistnae]|uniref:Short-chain dehydrogenase n=1 Tax=[Actinomadura] parvosata subsp. kistnae TaxID=1909395 RepID=A0A1V0ADJ2_9ACTN|nr:SDR family oxidoreductase [Nonomuraea sp. ATCC 55076]AQZ68239.1 short-chain dehydrogenase [Nonomuraea sp. ATCC 55076]SPL93352.1 3-oxoacyl-[acyl-carrier protein] reductase [Actinomadura parvosata subsp. kistnae]